jgi:hypothetical protein
MKWLDSEGLVISPSGDAMYVSSEKSDGGERGTSPLDIEMFDLQGVYLSSPFVVPDLFLEGIEDNAGFEALTALVTHTGDLMVLTANEFSLANDDASVR